MGAEAGRGAGEARTARILRTLHQLLTEAREHDDLFIMVARPNLEGLLDEVERLRAIEAAARALAADPWAGWHWDDDLCAHYCVACGESGPGGGDPPHHGETCPWAALRAALAGREIPTKE